VIDYAFHWTRFAEIKLLKLPDFFTEIIFCSDLISTFTHLSTSTERHTITLLSALNRVIFWRNTAFDINYLGIGRLTLLGFFGTLCGNGVR
jgi:hypothetical protein